MSVEYTVSDDQLKQLRETAVISRDEIAIIAGDIVLAEHVLTKERRRLQVSAKQLTEKKQLLKG